LAIVPVSPVGRETVSPNGTRAYVILKQKEVFLQSSIKSSTAKRCGQGGDGRNITEKRTTVECGSGFLKTNGTIIS